MRPYGDGADWTAWGCVMFTAVKFDRLRSARSVHSCEPYPNAHTRAFIKRQKCTTKSGGGSPIEGMAAAARKIVFNTKIERLRPGASVNTAIAHGVGQPARTPPVHKWQCSVNSFPDGTLGHPTECDVILKLMAPDGSDQRGLDRFNDDLGTISLISRAPGLRRVTDVRYP